MRAFLGGVMLCALLCAPVGVRAQSDEVPFALVAVNAGSPVVVDAAALGGRRSTGMLQATLRYQAGLICINAHNADARTASLVHYAFAYYDVSGKREGGEGFTRKGNFVSGLHINGFDPQLHTVHQENCSPIHYPKDGIGSSVFYVDHVEFVDGTSWDAPAVHLPDDVGSAFRPRATAHARTPAGTLVELAPLVAGAVIGCAQAQTLRTVVVPAFQGQVTEPFDASRNVFADAHGVCAPSGDASRDAAAQALAAKVPLLGNRAARVYFPYVDAGASCNAPARLMLAGGFALPAPANSDQLPAPGVYAVDVTVNVDAAGNARDPVVRISSGLPALDAAAQRGAVGSRYWPAIRQGSAVAGEAEVAFAAVYDAIDRSGAQMSETSHQYSSGAPAAPSGC